MAGPGGATSVAVTHHAARLAVLVARSAVLPGTVLVMAAGRIPVLAIAAYCRGAGTWTAAGTAHFSTTGYSFSASQSEKQHLFNGSKAGGLFIFCIKKDVGID